MKKSRSATSIGGIGHEREKLNSLPLALNSVKVPTWGKPDDLVPEHQVDVVSRQLSLEVLARCDPARLEALDQVDLHPFGRLEDAIGLRREDQCDVLQLALVVDQGAIAQFEDHRRGAANATATISAAAPAMSSVMGRERAWRGPAGRRPTLDRLSRLGFGAPVLRSPFPGPQTKSMVILTDAWQSRLTG